MRSRLQALRSRTDQLLGQYNLLVEQLTAAQAELDEALTSAEQIERSEQLLVNLGVELRQALKQTLEPLCTTAMQDVWGQDAGFEIQFSQTASGKHKATIVTRTAHFSGPPAETDGDSVAELLSLVIRIILVVLHYPSMAPLLLMDEPLSALDTNNLPAVGSLLQSVADDLGARGIPLQLVFTAHHLAPVLEPWANNTVTITKREGCSHVHLGLDQATYPEA